ncbi:hypothetical protein F4806DRAFT_338715 [Annulohypoxylon nitens]|nr:hypothetical protein F4806DRAFT_338715 [Annulohypoxylon nitens]
MEILPAQPKAGTGKNNSDFPTTSIGETCDKLWNYIQCHLVRTVLRIRELLKCLYRARDVEFNPQSPNPFNEAGKQDITAMIIQVTGIKATRTCSRCKQGKGPFRGCYIIPSSVPLHLRQLILCCANCYYKGNQGFCDLKQWLLRTYPELSKAPISKNTPQEQIIEPSLSQLAETKKLPERRSIRNTQNEERRKKKEIVRANTKQCTPPSSIKKCHLRIQQKVSMFIVKDERALIIWTKP